MAQSTIEWNQLKSSEINQETEHKNLLIKLSQQEVKMNRLEEEKHRLEKDLNYYQSRESMGMGNMSETPNKTQRQRLERQMNEGDVEEGLGKHEVKDIDDSCRAFYQIE